MPPFSSSMLNKRIGDIDFIDLNNYKTIDEFSNKFYIKKGFKKTGFALNGNVYMADYTSELRKEFTIEDLIIKNIEREELYLNDEKIEKFKKLKNGFNTVKISRTGHEYKYGMGSMQFPDPLDRPARTIVTSESSVSRMSHVIRDPGNGRLRVLSPIETERINTFPDDWTKLEGVSDANRYFTMGNALVVDLIKEIGEEIVKVVNANIFEDNLR